NVVSLATHNHVRLRIQKIRHAMPKQRVLFQNEDANFCGVLFRGGHVRACALRDRGMSFAIRGEQMSSREFSPQGSEDLKLARLPSSSPLPLAALPSMSPIPSAPFTAENTEDAEKLLSTSLGPIYTDFLRPKMEIELPPFRFPCLICGNLRN